MKQILQSGAKRMGIELTDRQLTQFETYYRLLLEWNQKMNLTAITEENEVVAKHFLDSLAGAPIVREIVQKGGSSLIDVGTGAGFPGIPLKILYPELSLTLLDSLQKRIRFLEAVGEATGLLGVIYIHGRAEDVAHEAKYREQYDMAVARAVAPMSVLLEYCSGFVKPGGCFLAYKGPSLPEEMAAITSEWGAQKMRCRTIREVTIPGTELNHFVAVVDKTGKLALQYPRKQSKIKKPVKEKDTGRPSGAPAGKRP
jgi:16S rRNA (guanine527-N7)-methyltransferase